MGVIGERYKEGARCKGERVNEDFGPINEDIEDFTLPHRFQVESTGFHLDLWTPGGLQVDFLWQRALLNYNQISPGIHLDSKWTSEIPGGLYGLHSTYT